MSLASLVVHLKANTSHFQRGMHSSGDMVRRWGGLVKTAIAGAAAAIGGSQLLGAASEMEETMNKFNVVFGDNASVVKAWSDGFAGDVGRSKQQIASFMAETQDLLVPIGFEAGAATQFSKDITGLAVDLASFNNLQDTDVLRDLQAALTGSGEVMKKYGVLLSQAAVNQELLNRGMDPRAASEQDKVQARLAIIMRGTTAAQGDAIRSAGSFANQMKALKASVSDAAVSLGSVLLPIVTPVITKVAQLIRTVDQFGPHLQVSGKIAVEVFKAIGSIVSATWGQITAVFSALPGAAALSSGQLGELFIGALSAIEYGFRNWQAVGELAIVNVQLHAVRFGSILVHLFTQEIPAVLAWFGDNWRDVFQTLWNFTQSVFRNMAANIRSVMREIWDFVKSGGSDSLEITWKPLTDGFVNTIKELPDIPKRAIGALESQLAADADRLGGVLGQGLVDHMADRIGEFRKAQATAVAAESAIVAPEVATTLADALTDSNDRTSDKKTETRFSGAMRRDSAEAFSTVIRAMQERRGDDPQRTLANNSQTQVSLLGDARQLLEQIHSSLEDDRDVVASFT